MKKRNQGLILGTLIGVAAAGISAFLYAPKATKELKKDITDKAEDAKEAAQDHLDVAVARGNEVVKTVQSAGSEYKNTLKDATLKMKQSVKEAVTDQKDRENQEKELDVADEQDSLDEGEEYPTHNESGISELPEHRSDGDSGVLPPTNPSV